MTRRSSSAGNTLEVYVARPAGAPGDAFLVDAVSLYPCDPPFGGFGGGVWPPACWRAYAPDSLFNQPIPAGAATWYGSGAVTDWFAGQGAGPINHPLGRDDYAPTTYYGRASDPVYTLVRDPRTLGWGPSNVDGARVHAPSGMRVTGDQDRLLTLVDQTTGVEYDLWYVNAIDDSSRTISFKWGGRFVIGANGIGAPDGFASEAGFGLLSGLIRYEELMAGTIDHALYLAVNGVRGRFEPAIDTGGNFKNEPGMPPMGARLQLTLSEAQIEAVTLNGTPAPWYYKVILSAAVRYGMFVSDEGGAPWGALKLESGLQYEAMGQEDPWSRFAREQQIPAYQGGWGFYPYLRLNDLRDPSGQSVWRNIRVVAPSAYGYSDDPR